MSITTKRTKTMDPFNSRLPLTVVELQDGSIGVIDESSVRVWVGHEFVASRTSADIVETIVLPEIPEHYGRWVSKAIGGVSKTCRRVGCIRTRTKHTDAVVVFATHAPSTTAVRDAVCGCGSRLTLGDTECDDEYGHVTEIVVHDSNDVDHVCALVARCGAVPILERAEDNASRCLGIERLDRIDSDATVCHDTIEGVEHGARRGMENWRFGWIPESWSRVPLTWDHLVGNVPDEERIASIPQPLRQHVAHERLRRGAHDTMGHRWLPAEIPPVKAELQGPPGLYQRRIVTCPALSTALAEGRDTFDADELASMGVELVVDESVLVRSDDGRWYRPRDVRNLLNMEVSNRPYVSAALEPSQSRQLITAFYLFSVERVTDPRVRTAAALVLYRYMVERGYTARWMGKYEQDAHFIGNGNKFRKFNRLAQYDPDRIPSEILNRICDRDGRLANRGSKGTRSKYRTTGRYRPERRLKRSLEDEAQMRAA